MNTVDATFIIPPHVALGLSNGSLERVGGVVREIKSKQVVTWLRENLKRDSVISDSSILSSATAAVDNLSTVVNNLSNVASTLNLAVSTMGFAIVLKRLGDIEQQLEQAQEVLRVIDYKIDLSFYANFRAALDLAFNTFTMTNSETRKMSAMQAINRFLEAEHHYTKLTDIEIGNGSQVADEYLTTLCLAYITEVRCYLELEELDTARRRLQEGAAVLRPRFDKLINTLLTSNPAAYLHPSVKEKVGLKHLTKVYQWLNPGVDENDIFDMQRENLFNLAQKPEDWIVSLPQAILIPKAAHQTNVLNGLAKQSKKFIGALPGKISKFSGLITGSQEAVTQSLESEIFNHLPAMMDLMGALVENFNRLAMYESEVATAHHLGMSFQEWQQLAPASTAHENGTDLIYVTVS
jgi:tetratricopeptide (TPR) repeat protein